MTSLPNKSRSILHISYFTCTSSVLYNTTVFYDLPVATARLWAAWRFNVFYCSCLYSNYTKLRLSSSDWSRYQKPFQDTITTGGTAKSNSGRTTWLTLRRLTDDVPQWSAINHTPTKTAWKHPQRSRRSSAVKMCGPKHDNNPQKDVSCFQTNSDALLLCLSSGSFKLAPSYLHFLCGVSGFTWHLTWPITTWHTKPSNQSSQ